MSESTIETINDAATWPAVTAGILAIVAALTYIIGSRGAWRGSLLGVAFVGILLAPLPFMAVPIARRLLGFYPGYQWWAWGLYLAAAGLYIVMLATIVIEQRRGRIVVPPLHPQERTHRMNSESKPSIAERVGEYRKAIAAFVVPALTVLGAALIPDVDGTVVVTPSEWVGVAIAALGTSVVVATVRNDEYTGS